MIKLMTRCLLLLAVLVGGGLRAYSQTVQRDSTQAMDLIFRQVMTEDYNGSAYRLDGSVFRDVPVTHLSNVLSGLVPGFYSRSASGGMDNETASYWIRGIRTYSEGVLVLVDGQARSFGTLSPEEIESVTVLKDAAATVLYGMRASNGAILIKTRQGSTGAPRVNFSMQFINQRPIDVIDPLDASGYAHHYNQAMISDGTDAIYSAYEIDQYKRSATVRSEKYPNVDWMDKYFRDGSWVQRYNLSVSGGTQKTRYFVNAGYTHQGGMFNTEDEFKYSTNNKGDRYNIRSNVEMDLTSTTRLNVDLYGWYESQTYPGTSAYNVYHTLLSTPANAFPEWFEDNGNYVDGEGNRVVGFNGKIVATNSKTHANPWAMLNRNGYNKNNHVYGSFRTALTQDLSMITPGLELSAVLSMDSETNSTIGRTKSYARYYVKDWNNPTVFTKVGDDGVMTNTVDGKNATRATDFEAQLSYARTFKRHSVAAMAFYEQFENASDTGIPTRYQGVGGWLNYNFDKRYGIDVMMNYQGDYRFAPGHKFGFFPAVAAGWTISNEPFMENVREFMPYLKLRASYGITGNSRGVDAFYYMSNVTSNSGAFVVGNAMNTTLGGYRENTIANPNLTWEESRLLNIGVDARLFKGRLALTAEFFHDDRSQIYVGNSQVNTLLGLPISISENIGEMYTRGVDISAQWNDKIGDWHYSLGGMFSFSKNKVTRLGQVEQPYSWMMDIGYPRGIKSGYIVEGLFDSWDEIAAAPYHTFSEVQPGDFRYRDVNGDGIIDNHDSVPLGYSSTPQIFYGFNASISWKGLTLSALFQGAARVSNTYGGSTIYPFYDDATIYKHQLGYWTPETGGTTLPRIAYNHESNMNNSKANSVWIQDSDYLRLKTLELSYDVPQAKLGGEHAFVKGLRVFVSGYNLFCWTDYKWTDPEANASSEAMPLTRNISVGCSIKF